MDKIKPIHVVITGPESSGKTTLSLELQAHYQAELIQEVARTYLQERGKSYDTNDIRQMAFQQFSNQLSVDHSSSMIISDTSLLNMMIWNEVKFHHFDDQINEWYHLQQIDFYLLMYPDIPWIDDGLRENEHRLEFLFDIFLKKIKESNIPYAVIKGQGAQRTKDAISAIDQFINNLSLDKSV